MSEMTNKKAKWYNSRAKAFGGYAVMQPIGKNKAADIYYRKSANNLLQAFFRRAVREVRESYDAIYSENAAVSNATKSPSKVARVFQSLRGRQLDMFKDAAEKIVFRYVRKVTKSSKKDTEAALSRFYGSGAIQFNVSRYDEITRALVQRNVALLTNTAQETIDSVENIVYNAMTTGRGWADIESNLKTESGIAERRIKRIARDQTAKASEAINIFMQREAGAEYFEWSTSKDERVSTGYGGHKQLDGKIYRYGEPERYPIIDSYGHRGLPAERVNCRCTALSVFIMDGYQAKWSSSEECYRIVRE